MQRHADTYNECQHAPNVLIRMVAMEYGMPSLSAHCLLPIAHEPLCILVRTPRFPRNLPHWSGLRPLCRPFYRRTPRQARPRRGLAGPHLAFFFAARLSTTIFHLQEKSGGRRSFGKLGGVRLFVKPNHTNLYNQ